MNKKDRRHSGYVSPTSTISKNELLQYDLFIDDFYDDWEDSRDGYRDWYKDFKLIKKIFLKPYRKDMMEKRLIMNKKQIRLLKRREIRKNLRNFRKLYAIYGNIFI
jgi:hypothetical protein